VQRWPVGLAVQRPDSPRRRQGGLRRMHLGTKRDADGGNAGHDEKDAGQPGGTGTEGRS
jgi:hypothetical protein